MNLEVGHEIKESNSFLALVEKLEEYKGKVNGAILFIFMSNVITCRLERRRRIVGQKVVIVIHDGLNIDSHVSPAPNIM